MFSWNPLVRRMAASEGSLAGENYHFAYRCTKCCRVESSYGQSGTRHRLRSPELTSGPVWTTRFDLEARKCYARYVVVAESSFA
jgi:hypothetical protein